MAVMYRYDRYEKSWNIRNTWVGGLILFYEPSECIMFVPGSYQEMLKDYD
jgi:hypothetical protein